MNDRTSVLVAYLFLIVVAMSCLIAALHDSGMPISGWALVCSVDDKDVVSCFRNWITSGAAVLTGVAIVFAVAQVREATKQSVEAARQTIEATKQTDVALREALVSYRSDVQLEIGALCDLHFGQYRLVSGWAITDRSVVASLVSAEIERISSVDVVETKNAAIEFEYGLSILKGTMIFDGMTLLTAEQFLRDARTFLAKLRNSKCDSTDLAISFMVDVASPWSNYHQQLLDEVITTSGAIREIDQKHLREVRAEQAAERERTGAGKWSI